MSEEAIPPVVNSSVEEPATTRQEDNVEAEMKDAEKAGTNGTSNGEMDIDTASPNVASDNAPVENKTTSTAESANDEQTTADDVTQVKPATSQEDTEMEDTKANDAAPAAEESSTPTAGKSASSSKARRKSGGVPEHKGKKVNKKAVKMTHTDAKPGDYFYVRLKGYPLWPAIVCDESMLPTTLLKSRPVTAAKPDGTYRDDFMDGGPKVKDRTFPVMYLHTNEFGFIPNYDLVEIDFDEVANIGSNMRKDLAEARRLAAEQNDLDYFKEILKTFMEQREADILAKEQAKAEKKAKKAAKKNNGKSEATVRESDDEGDVEMTDIIGDDMESAESSKPKKNGNGKRENDDTEPPAVKKPRIKLNTAKSSNGTSTPKAAKEPAAPKSSVKKEPRKRAPKVKAAADAPEAAVPKEPELSAEEKAAKKEKEILFLRHKLQKGLLTRDQEPKADEMKNMSEFVSKLEGYADLEVSIIRQTKINKVLKAILKLNTIPKEEEFKFKPRSQALLDKWNKLLANESGAPASNGESTEAKPEVEEGKASPKEAKNGIKESSTDDKVEPKPEDNLEEKLEERAEEKVSTEEPAVPEAKDEPMVDSAPAVEETAKDVIEAATPVEAAA